MRAVIYPNAIRLQARAVSEQGKSSFTWSHPIVASGLLIVRDQDNVYSYDLRAR